MANKKDNIDIEKLSDEELKREILRARLDKERVLAEKARFALQVDTGVYVTKEEFYGELSSRTIAFESGVKAAVRSCTKRVIHACRGDMKKVAVCQEILVSGIEAVMGEMGKHKTWRVIYEPDDTSDTVKKKRKKKSNQKVVKEKQKQRETKRKYKR